jgi:hypothetical protein
MTIKYSPNLTFLCKLKYDRNEGNILQRVDMKSEQVHTGQMWSGLKKILPYSRDLATSGPAFDVSVPNLGRRMKHCCQIQSSKRENAARDNVVVEELADEPHN